MNNFSEWKCLELIFRKNKIIFWRKINWQATNGTFAIASVGLFQCPGKGKKM